MPHTSDTFKGQYRRPGWSLVILSPELLGEIFITVLELKEQ